MSAAKKMKSPIMNPALRDFWMTQSRFKILYGGRDSSKSWDTAAHAIRLANNLPLRFLCTRMYQNRIEESVYTLLKKQIWRFGFAQDYRILNNKIYQLHTGSEFVFYGLARNVDEVKSLEGIDVLWVEEGHSLTEEMWEVIEPTIRKEGSEIWVILNPNLITDFAYQRFIANPPENAVTRKINYNENPFLSNTSKETIDRIREEDYDSYLHIYEGEPKQDDDEVIIKRSWINAAIDAHIKLNINPVGVKITGYDVADDGNDLNAIVNRYGILVSKVDQWKAGEDELVKSSKRARNEAKMFGSKVVYDSIGVGAGVGSNIKELNSQENNQVNYKAFNSGGEVFEKEKEYRDGVKNRDYFFNLKAQAWKLVADRFLKTYNAVTKGGKFEPDEIISISSDCNLIEDLITELSTPKKQYDNVGRLRVESKKDMKKRGIDSPNLADSFIMAFEPTKDRKPLEPKLINF